MPDLNRAFLDYDLGLLRIIADLWGLEIEAPTQREASTELATKLLQADLVEEVVEALRPEARATLDALTHEGRLPLAHFMRKHGELRAMGPARRDREQPWLNAPSPAETLWYRGLIARAFFDDGNGPQEFVFIPDDLMRLVPVSRKLHPELVEGVSLTPLNPDVWTSAVGVAPDDSATLLAYLQIASVKLEGADFPPKHREAVSRFLRLPNALDFYTQLIIHLGLAAGSPLKLDPSHARPFLEAERPQQIQALARAWRESKDWNDLLHLPGLIFEGKAWRNDPLTAREAILNLLSDLRPPGEWWSLDAFRARVKERQPDFQRPAGDYDSWYIRDATTQEYVRGFENWERVDGALIAWIIQQPLYWLGLVEKTGEALTAENAESAERKKEKEREKEKVSANSAHSAVNPSCAAFRLTPYGAAFFGHQPWPEPEPEALLTLNAEGTLCVPVAVSRYNRFQIARVSDWLPLEPESYVYRFTPKSLERAARQGVKIAHLLAFLQKASGEAEVPPPLVGALRRWERTGGEAALKDTAVLKLKHPALLETLRDTPGIRQYLGESLGPAAVEVRRENLEKLRAALMELGILVD
jgi:hypothetical protein